MARRNEYTGRAMWLENLALVLVAAFGGTERAARIAERWAENGRGYRPEFSGGEDEPEAEQRATGHPPETDTDHASTPALGAATRAVERSLQRQAGLDRDRIERIKERRQSRRPFLGRLRRLFGRHE